MTLSTNLLMPASMITHTGPVFHYTSSVGLLGILESRSIRASAASSLNDLGEIRQGWNLIKDLLTTQPASPTVEVLQEFAADPLRNEHEVFVLSGSTEDDDANQWRLYADNGRGYALELDGSVQLAAISDDPGEPPDPVFGVPPTARASITPWYRVLYSKASVKAAIEELIRTIHAAEQSIKAAALERTEFDACLYYEALEDDAYEALSAIASLIKSPGFVGENEVRVVVRFGGGDSHIKHRGSPSGIVGYARLAEATGGKAEEVVRPPAIGVPLATTLPVRSVRLGPLLRPEHVSTVSAFLRINKYPNVSVTESAVPLR